MSEQEHQHSWQWAGYYFTLYREGVLQFLCECGWQKEERFPMSESWYDTAYAIWQFEQHNHGIFDPYKPAERARGRDE